MRHSDKIYYVQLYLNASVRVALKYLCLVKTINKKVCFCTTFRNNTTNKSLHTLILD